MTKRSLKVVTSHNSPLKLPKDLRQMLLSITYKLPEWSLEVNQCDDGDERGCLRGTYDDRPCVTINPEADGTLNLGRFDHKPLGTFTSLEECRNALHEALNEISTEMEDAASEGRLTRYQAAHEQDGLRLVEMFNMCGAAKLKELRADFARRAARRAPELSLRAVKT